MTVCEQRAIHVARRVCRVAVNVLLCLQKYAGASCGPRAIPAATVAAREIGPTDITDRARLDRCRS